MTGDNRFWGKALGPARKPWTGCAAADGEAVLATSYDRRCRREKSCQPSVSLSTQRQWGFLPRKTQTDLPALCWCEHFPLTLTSTQRPLSAHRSPASRQLWMPDGRRLQEQDSETGDALGRAGPPKTGLPHRTSNSEQRQPVPPKNRTSAPHSHAPPPWSSTWWGRRVHSSGRRGCGRRRCCCHWGTGLGGEYTILLFDLQFLEVRDFSEFLKNLSFS